jgi:hypothetical protein
MNGYNTGMTYGCGGPCAYRQTGQQTAPAGCQQSTQMTPYVKQQAAYTQQQTSYTPQQTPYVQQQMGQQMAPTAGRQQAVQMAPYTQQSMMPAASADMTPVESVAPATLDTTAYMAGLLKTFIGDKMRVQYLIGTTGPMIDVTGTLMQVGANYIILRPIETDDLMISDLYSIKFVTVLR